MDVGNVDASWAGGPTQWWRVAALAAAFGAEMGHHEDPQIAAHLLASVPHRTYVECFHPERSAFLEADRQRAGVSQRALPRAIWAWVRYRAEC